MATITLETLRKEYDRGRVVAVDDLSLEVDDGEFITVVGPSGCGKSTTLRMVAGLESPSDGTIRIGDEDVTEQSARTRDVAMVFQNYALYPHKTVMQNMAFGLRMSTDLSKDEREARVRETASMMGIEDLLDDKPDELSGGQKQRVALGRAIVREPDVFLFDEPLSNLDAKLRTTMRTEIQRLQNEFGITSLYVTHDQEEAMTMGDRIVILKDGKLQQVGRPKDVYENPANEFVGGFVGSPSMNFVDVTLDREGDSTVLVADDGPFSYELSDDFAAHLRDEISEPAVRVGIRPEDITTTTTTDDSKAIRTTVEVVEPIGSDNYLHLDVAPDFIARVDSGVEPSAGDSIRVTFDESDLHVFDKQTGESLLYRESKQTAAPVQ
ncbi:ABC transporter ATP-binding protein [Haloferax larsenii]|uniref:ABC transporter ATP-binding protein n=1 Tax=Haloferax larsenii TaxID=302484 RepID=A0ABY5RH40_HALLR|nr:ABC transporter ATP-binding protein [Haloferax larsenii]ELZ74808.1 putative maltose ABC transporter ATP-binding protein [Haloferax larsenii JCM 13917]UVE51691.1 ABC transporter ATP-binding protein [Haloferax larsenii]